MSAAASGSELAIVLVYVPPYSGGRRRGGTGLGAGRRSTRGNRCGQTLDGGATLGAAEAVVKGRMLVKQGEEVSRRSDAVGGSFQLSRVHKSPPNPALPRVQSQQREEIAPGWYNRPVCTATRNDILAAFAAPAASRVVKPSRRSLGPEHGPRFCLTAFARHLKFRVRPLFRKPTTFLHHRVYPRAFTKQTT